MHGGKTERFEAIVDRIAAALFAGAAAYSFYGWLSGVYRQPQLGIFSAIVAIVAFLTCARALGTVQPEARRFAVPAFEVPEIHASQPDELLLTDIVEPDELLLTDFDRLRPDELMLDDILAELGPDSRVVRLFDPNAIPTPGQLNDRIARHIREGSSPAPAPPDASQALHDALAELRRSLR
jgi:hypothetical protein